MNATTKIGAGMFNMILFFVLSFNPIQAQEFNLSNGESSVKVLGTSSLHDWHEVAEKQQGNISFSSTEDCQISKLNVVIEAESLKSGKSMMDKNTYKALNTDKYKTISYQMLEVKSVSNKGNGEFVVSTMGDLTISGVKKRVALDFTATVSNTKVKLTGEKKIKMTDFNVEPPKALFGTITTGDEITIEFITVFK